VQRIETEECAEICNVWRIDLKLFVLPTIFCDFESYWAADYTLSKMPTQSYILDERFKAHGACIAVNDGPIKWVKHEALPRFLTLLTEKYPTAIWAFHNALFDATILSLIYGIHPCFIADTAGMSRALVGPQLKSHSLDKVSQLLLQQEKGKELIKTLGIRDLPPELEREIAGYCAKDVHLMREDYKILAPLFPAAELEVMTWVTRMMTQPRIYLDEQMLWEYHNEVVARKGKILEELGIDKKDIMSNDKFATLLLNYGVVPPTKTREPTENEKKKGKFEEVTKYAFAKTDQGLKDLLEHENEDVQALVAARLELKSTIEETRSKTFAELAQFNPVGVPLAYSGAVNTHRLSGRDSLNMQNLKRGGIIRDSIVAPEGFEFVVSDLSQIELRFVLQMAGHTEKVEFLNSGGDLYSELASGIYGIEVTKAKAKVDRKIEEMRHVGKECQLGCQFGMGAPKFQVYLGGKGVVVTPEFAKNAVNLYRRTHPRVVRLWATLGEWFFQLLDTQEEFWVELGGVQLMFGFDPLFAAPGIRLPNGLWLKYPHLKIEDKQWTYINGGNETKIFGGHWLENIAQALARIAIMEKSVKINRRYPVVMSTHDELTAVVPQEQAEEAEDWIHSIMIDSVPWIPELLIGSETSRGTRYGEIK